MIQPVYGLIILYSFYLVFGFSLFSLLYQICIFSLQPSRDTFESCFGVALSPGNLVIATVWYFFTILILIFAYMFRFGNSPNVEELSV